MALTDSIIAGPQWLTVTTLAAAVFAGSLAATGYVLRVLRRRRILDHPNQRSSHTDPTPRGGGVGLLVVLLPIWIAVALLHPPLTRVGLVIAAAATALAVVSWIDDVAGLSALVRLIAQALAVAVGLWVMAPDFLVFQGWLPAAVDRLAAVLLWLWFVNLFNFMDGIDAMAGSEAACIALGLALLALVAPADAAEGALAPLAATLGAAALGFLWWNWPPAKVFLGDVGSVPLGFLIGWLLLEAAAAGFWKAALILPLYYLADATVTLVRRGLRGESVWEAHAEHFYQQAVRRGFGHAGVVRAVVLANLGLVALALLSAHGPEPAAWGALAAAGVLVAGLLAWLARARPVGSHEPRAP